MIIDELETKKGLIKIFFDNDGQIKRINLPVLETNETSTEIKKILETNNVPGSDYNKENYWIRNGGFAGKVFLNKDTKVLSIPADETVYQNFKTVAYNKVSGANIVKCYSFDAESPYAKIVLIYQEASATSYLSTENGTIGIYYVTKIIESINDDGEDGTEVTLFDGKDYITVFSAKKANNKSLFEDAFNAVGTTEKGLTVQRGDFIMCGYDNVTGEIAAVRIIYDASEVNPAWCGANPDSNLTKCSHTDEDHTTAFRGTFPGTTGFYFTAKWKDVTNTNPIGYLHESASGYEPRLPGSTSQRHMFVQGFVYQTKEGLYEFTTQNLTENFTERDEANYMWAFDDFTGKNPKVFTVKDDGTVDTASLMNIKSYKQAGKQATRCLFYYVAGRINQIWLLP